MTSFAPRMVAVALGCLVLAPGRKLALSPVRPPEGRAQRAVLVATPPAEPRAAHYPSNRPPLAPVPLARLPIGAITALGWLRTQLVLERDGMVGHMEEISPWCDFEKSAWAHPDGEGQYGWEEMPYWLKGYTDLAFVLGDATHRARAMRWLNAILASQRPDGYFGPERNRKSLDLWPNMLVLFALRSLHEATGDPRVIPFMQRYFRWQASLPAGQFLAASWQHVRGGDNLDSIYWLYNRTGESWLLDLARRNHESTAPWEKGIASLHGVNFAQGFREPAQYYQQSHDRRHLAATIRNYEEMRRAYGQVPGGMYGADENARPGYNGPRQGTETCSFVEMMYSCEELVRITGDTVWADRCEDVALNSFPASLAPDLKALHYLTCPNQVVLDRSNKAPMIQNSGDMFSYTPYEQYRCCQHNVAFGWPYYAEHLWMATRDRGLAAVLYAPSRVTAKVGDGAVATFESATNYPFGETIALRVKVTRSTDFPLYLRVPGWCEAPTVHVNGIAWRVGGKAAGKWIRLLRRWRSGDAVRLTLPMRIRVIMWPENRNTASVQRGPLTYSLRIAEQWKRYDTGRSWPGFEVWPATLWNVGLVIDSRQAERSFTVVKGSPLVDGQQPFRWDRAPVLLRTRVRPIPNWRLESNNLVGEVQRGPILSREPEVEATLIPMGCARLRISAFPIIGLGKDSRPWPDAPPGASASWVNPADTLSALGDGVLPKSSADTTIPRFTWWDHLGTREWVQYSFAKPRVVSGCAVYWFDDEPVGGRCRLPESWKILLMADGTWREAQIQGTYEIRRDGFSSVTLQPVTASAVRLEVQLKPGFSGGILEWRLQP